MWTDKYTKQKLKKYLKCHKRELKRIDLRLIKSRKDVINQEQHNAKIEKRIKEIENALKE